MGGISSMPLQLCFLVKEIYFVKPKLQVAAAMSLSQEEVVNKANYLTVSGDLETHRFRDRWGLRHLSPPHLYGRAEDRAGVMVLCKHEELYKFYSSCCVGTHSQGTIWSNWHSNVIYFLGVCWHFRKPGPPIMVPCEASSCAGLNQHCHFFKAEFM